MASILLVDDESDIVQTWSKALIAHGFGPVDCAGDGTEGLAMLCEGRYDLCLLDLKMPKMSGLEVLAAVHELALPIRIVLVSGQAEREQTAEAFRLGALDVWFKPMRLHELTDKVSSVTTAGRPSPHVLAAKLDQLLAERFTKPGVNLLELCEPLAISESYGEKLFRDHAGMSFGRRLRLRRLARAKELLADPRKSIAEVAEESGFGDYRRLDEAFAHEEGTSPTAWRRNECGKPVKVRKAGQEKP